MDGIRFTTLMDRLTRGEPLGIDTALVTCSSIGPRDADEGIAYPLTQHKDVTIGRNKDADVVLEVPEISRRHCAVGIRDDPTRSVTVTDLGTRNGTMINGRDVPRGRPLSIAGKVASVRLADRTTVAIMDPKSLSEYLWMLIRARRP